MVYNGDERILLDGFTYMPSFGINLNVEVRGKIRFYRISADIIETFIV